MNAAMKCVFTATVIGLAGCATQGPARPALFPPGDISAEQAQRYQYECKNQAMLVDAPDYKYKGTFMEGVSIEQKQAAVYDNCLRSKGFTLMAASNGVPSTQVKSVSDAPARSSNWRPVNP